MTPDRAVDSPGASVWLPLLLPHLPAAWARRLTDGPKRRLLESLSCDGLTALECALQAPPGEALLRFDIAQRVERSDQAALLASRLRVSTATETLERWASGVMTEAVPSLWVEFDFDPRDSDGALPAPLVCLRLAPEVDAATLLDRVVPSLFAATLADDQRRTLCRLLGALPPTGRPLYLFDLSPRRARTLRLELIGLAAPVARRYVEAVLPTEIARRAVELLPWIDDSDRPHLSFDVHVDGSIDDRIGVETSYARLPHREPRWSRLFERLVDAGLCADAARDALFAWPGQDRRADAGADWPDVPTLADGHLVRVPSHVKLVSTAEGPVEAKGYVLFQYLPRRPGTRS